MAENFYTILTNTGKAKLANAQALGTTVQFSSIAVGDGSGNYYDPIESQTALKNEVWCGPINQIKTDSENPNWIIVEVVIPTSTGGFTVREAGIIDSEGDLIALGKYPATYKPALAEGSGKDLYIRMILEVSNTSVVTLKIDPAVVLSTRGYVDDSIAEHNTAPLAHGNLPYLKTSEVVTSPEPNKVLKLDAAGKLPTSITGNAATATIATTANDSSTLNGKPDTAFQEMAEKDQPGGYAGLDADGHILESALPAISELSPFTITARDSQGDPTAYILDGREYTVARDAGGRLTQIQSGLTSYILQYDEIGNLMGGAYA
ncbi:phage tail protein [Aminobacterium sp. EBM-42]|uniref:phage tail protein n=1 Tax=Aminobacterium sp. EBM-42 TaxID=1918503 RepID=UPI000AB48232|nr:phage tail protein [Aminobacterium sp. EBM-42]